MPHTVAIARACAAAEPRSLKQDRHTPAGCVLRFASTGSHAAAGASAATASLLAAQTESLVTSGQMLADERKRASDAAESGEEEKPAAADLERPRGLRVREIRCQPSTTRRSVTARRWMDQRTRVKGAAQTPAWSSRQEPGRRKAAALLGLQQSVRPLASSQTPITAAPITAAVRPLRLIQALNRMIVSFVPSGANT
jgi:hypothetical protein